MKYILPFVICVFATGCKSQEIDFIGLESSERSFNDRQLKESAIHMSIEDMFPDRRIRMLAAAAGNGDVSELERLSKEVDVNSQGARDLTPLFWALRAGNADGFEKLLQLGADPNAAFAESSVMHWAARHQDIRFLKLALDHGGNPNLYAGKPSQTPLFETIGVPGSDNLSALYLLLESGADINARTASEEMFGIPMGGKSPTLMAADVVRYDIVYELLIRGADASIEDDIGRDLFDRIASVNGRFPENSEQSIALDKIAAWLAKQGAG